MACQHQQPWHHRTLTLTEITQQARTNAAVWPFRHLALCDGFDQLGSLPVGRLFISYFIGTRVTGTAATTIVNVIVVIIKEARMLVLERLVY